MVEMEIANDNMLVLRAVFELYIIVAPATWPLVTGGTGISQPRCAGHCSCRLI